MSTLTSSKRAGILGRTLAWLRSKRGRTILQISLIALVLVVFVGQLVLSWGDPKWQHLKFNYGYLALSFIPLVGRPFLSAYGWWRVVRRLDGDLSLARAINIYFISGLARYLPGPFLGSVGRAVLAEEAGVLPVTATLSVLLELGLLIASGVILGLVWAVTNLPNNQLGYLLLFGAGSLVLLNPRIFLPLLNRLLGRLGRKRVQLDLHLGDMLVLLAPYLLNWLLNGLTFYLVLQAIFPGSSLLNIAGIYIVAYTIAIFGLIAPDGWGVRELTLSTMLVNFANIAAVLATGLALFARIWWMVGEACWVALALYLGRRLPPTRPAVGE